jgi:putative membrane protein insertion efficiency factor
VNALGKVAALPAIALVRAYQLLLGPLLGGNCKFHPSCSEYALEALRQYGLLRGSALAGWRLLRCNPWSHGGVDHVDGQTLFAHRPAEGRRA